ncbi:MAG: hypothetical protein ABID04_03135, partial [Patescibacteria group bacterium]
QLVTVSFILPQPFTRYFYPVFPFLILLTSYFLSRLKKTLLILSFLLLIIGLGNKIALEPSANYSLNEDMQEIPEVDWKKIYGLVGEKLEKNPGSILLTNWNDLPVWYLGEGSPDYLTRTDGDRQDKLSGAMIVNNLDQFRKLVDDNPTGLIVLDSWDDKVPDGIREYCHQNLKKEFEIDRLYPVQPRYWTVWVYSWGI